MKPRSRKEEIIDQAAKLFQKRGYSAVTMRDIAEEMEIKAASLYNHISGKHEILSLLVLSVAQQFTEGMDAVCAKTLSPTETLKAIIEMHIDVAVSHANGIAVMNNDWMHLEHDELTRFVAMRDGYEENVRAVIKEGILEGTIRDLHPEVLLFSMLSTLRTIYLWYQKRGKIDVNILKKDMVAVLLKGVV
ncbi:MAG: TetR/AcrR family transcriptional regulator [Bacteroidetes bacterium]|nr:TetR/AcrR family transcriptional regulator [Bacteroidota bacterium]